MIRLAAALALALLVAPQQEQEPSIEEELDALIAKTNALETFHAVYRAEAPSEEDGDGAVFDLFYEAPDRARVSITAREEGGGPSMVFWVVQNRLVSHVVQDGEEQWRVIEMRPPESWRILDELFPPEELPLSPGVDLWLQLAPEGINLSFRYNEWGRYEVLNWLSQMKAPETSVVREPSQLVWSGEGWRALLSRESGFLTRIEAESRGRTLILDELRLDEELDPGLMELPESARDLEPDEDSERASRQTFKLGYLRDAAFQRVERALRAEERTWNETTRADWRTFLVALQREMIMARHAKWIAQLSAQVVEFEAGLRSRLARDPTPERRAELRKFAEERRAKLGEGFDQAEAQWIDGLAAIEADTEPRQELFDVELEVIEEVCDELLRKPILDDFDARVAEVFG